MILSKCAVCNTKNLRFIKEQEASGLLSSLGIKTPLSQIPLGGTLLFLRYKVNEIVNKLALAGDKFMPEMHLGQPGIHIMLIDHVLKTKKKIQLKETGDSRYIY